MSDTEPDPLLPALLSPFALPDPAAEARTSQRLLGMTLAQLRSRRDRIDRGLFERGLNVGEPALAIPSVRGTGLLDVDRILRKLERLDEAREQERLERELDRQEGNTALAKLPSLGWLGAAFRAREVRARKELLTSELGLALCAADQRVLGEYAPHVHRLLAEHRGTARRIDELFTESRLLEDELERRLSVGDAPPRKEIDVLLERALDSVDEVTSQLGEAVIHLGKQATKGALSTGGNAVWAATRGAAQGAWSLGSSAARRLGGGEGEAPQEEGPFEAGPFEAGPFEALPRGPRPVIPLPLRPATPASASAGIPDLIRDLARLRDEGVLSEGEFQSKKQELLDRL